jgi:hypothetical protein
LRVHRRHSFARQEIRLRNRDERVGLLRAPTVARELPIRRELDAARDLSIGDRVVERFDDDFSVLYRELDGDRERATRRVATHGKRTPFPSRARRVRRLRRDVAHLPAALLYLRRTRVERVREQQVLVRSVRGARERADFGIRQPSIRERGRDCGQATQRMCRAQLLASGRHRHPAAPREPLGAAAQAPLREAEAIVEIADQQQETIGLGVHLPREAADLEVDLVDREVGARSACGVAVCEGGLEAPYAARCVLVLYTVIEKLPKSFQYVMQ